MNEPVLTLDPLTFPLQASQLIEASAGTGKTWTIAALYVRLILGHPDRAAMSPEQILVMTFTRAATAELKERIRLRLLETAAYLRHPPAQPGEAFMHGLYEHYREQSPLAVAEAAWRLDFAAESMDQASIQTIDAWCHRMLREYALESMSSAELELQNDDAQFLQQAVLDVWRQQFYPLSPLASKRLRDVLGDVSRLQAKMAAWLAHLDDEAQPELGSLQDSHDQLERQVASLKDDYRAPIEHWYAWLCANKACFNGTKLPAKSLEKHWRAWLRWLEGPGVWVPEGLEQLMQWCSPAWLQERLKVQQAPAIPEWGLERLGASLQALYQGLLRDLTLRVRERCQNLKKTAQVWTFLDVQKKLAQVLSAPAGARLRARIVQQFPVVLIDEFQDTSRLQYLIFAQLYGLSAPASAATMLLIGDPKQSIYAFRGADIESYLEAQAATQGRHHRLQVNYRSSTAYIGVLNRFYAAAQSRSAQGAFYYGERLLASPVQAQGRRDRLQVAGQDTAAWVWACSAEQLGNKEDRRRLMAEAAARDLREHLDDDQTGWQDASGVFRRLAAADVAILVYDRNEAAEMKSALLRQGIASTYLSQNNSVYDSAEARDILIWLQAVARPRDTRLARAAYACAWMACSLDELRMMSSEDDFFEQRMQLLQDLHQLWQEQGVLAMLRQTLFRLQLPGRWRLAEDGERRLTNVLHLAELLQKESTGLHGEQALIRLMSERMQDQSGRQEDQFLRLESESDLVRIITIHKSKGLEYPIVYLPFIERDCPSSRVSRKPDELWASAPVDASAQLREELRLIYVAITRARHRLWLGLGAHPRPGTALAYLLAGTADASWRDILASIFQPGDAVAYLDIEQLNAKPVSARPSLPQELAPPRLYQGRFQRDERIVSYSSLTRVLSGYVAEPPKPATILPAASVQPWHTLPAGSQAGTIIHDQLALMAEHKAFASPPQELQRLLQLAAADEQLAWLSCIVASPLGSSAQSLRQLSSCAAELEFWLPLEPVHVEAIDAICQEHLLPGQSRPQLSAQRLRGLLMGYIDLLFCDWQGRYWVVDYKSNRLGPDDASYEPAALAQAVLTHRYDVQMALYLVAVHRHLQARLGQGYEPERDLAGGMNYFLRACARPQGACLEFAAGAWVDELSRLFAGSGVSR